MADPARSAPAPSASQAVVAQPAVAPPRRDLTAPLRAIPRGTVALALTALLLTLVTWPVLSLQPAGGLDPSWMTGLHMAFNQGLDAGTQVLFSYGPLGFLRQLEYAYPWSTRAAFAYALVQQLLLCGLLLWVLRRNFGSLLLAAPIALVVATVLFQEPVPVIVFAIAVCVVRGEFQRGVPAILAGTGAFVALQLLAKLNVGVVALALCVIAILALGAERRRAAAWFACGLAVTLAAGWVLTGQSLAGIPDYLSGSLQVISGYSEAMGFHEAGRAWELWTALALTIVGLVVIARGEALSPSRRKLALTVMWVVLAFTAFKAGFVRHDSGHVQIFFATMLGGLAVLPMQDMPRSSALFILVFATMAMFASYRVDPAEVISPVDRADAFFDEVGTLASGTKLNASIVAAREGVKPAYALSPPIYAALRGHRSHVDPQDTNVLWAYQLPWKPVPIFQPYTAYTAALDKRNADAFAAADGPERVLRHAVPAVDGRNPAWESPAAVRAMLCHFREVVAVAPWQVLERVPNRCGPARLLKVVKAAYGTAIMAPPSPGKRTIVYAKLDGVAVSGFERIATAAFRARDRLLIFAGQGPWRLVPGTAADGLIMHVPPAVDFKAPFALNQPAKSFYLTRGSKPSDDPIRASFYAVDVR